MTELPSPTAPPPCLTRKDGVFASCAAVAPLPKLGCQQLGREGAVLVGSLALTGVALNPGTAEAKCNQLGQCGLVCNMFRGLVAVRVEERVGDATTVDRRP